MADLNGFDAEKVEPSRDFEALPAGEYLAIATESEMKPTKSGDGEYLQISWEVLDGDHKGRLIWERLNLKNKSETAVKIAYAQLSSLCRAVGVLRPRDSSELHGKPCLLKVSCEERSDKPGSYRNEIKDHKPASSTKAQAPAVAGNKPPWKR